MGNLLEVGGKRFFVLNKTENPTVGTMFDAFRSGHYVNIVLTMFLRELFTSLWTLLLVIPGIVKHYEYLMIPYILAENPGMDRKEAFQISKRMMDGQKMETFILDLSFLGWDILTVITCGMVGFSTLLHTSRQLLQSYMHLIKQKHMRKDISDNGDQQINEAGIKSAVLRRH